jgi:hypothetical protein
MSENSSQEGLHRNPFGEGIVTKSGNNLHAFIPMRKTAKIPRIIQLVGIEGFKVFCAFDNGEYRILDFQRLFQSASFQKDPFLKQLMDPDHFSRVELREGTLCWPHLVKKIKLSNGVEFDAPLDLDPVVLYKESLPNDERNG